MYRLVTLALGGVAAGRRWCSSVLGPVQQDPVADRRQRGGRGRRQRARQPRVRRPLAHPRAHRVGGHHRPDPRAAVLAGDHARRARRRRRWRRAPGRAVQVRRRRPRATRAQPRRRGRAGRGAAWRRRSAASGHVVGGDARAAARRRARRARRRAAHPPRLALVADLPRGGARRAPAAARRRRRRTARRAPDGPAVVPAGLRGRVHAHRAAHPAAAPVAAAGRGRAGRRPHGRTVQPRRPVRVARARARRRQRPRLHAWVSAARSTCGCSPSGWSRPGIREVAFASDAAVRFRPGQWIELHVPHAAADARGSRRVFSLATPPDHADGVAVAFRVTDAPSSFKQALSALPEGGLVRATGVGGDFVLPQGPRRPAAARRGGHRHHAVREPAGTTSPARGRSRDVVVVLLLGSGRRGSPTPTCSSTAGRAWSS